MNDFNKIASIYDGLAWLVFFGSLNRAKRHFLPQVKSGQRILILGGGSGKILEYLSDENLTIDFVESSSKMIMKARRRNTVSKVIFFQLRFEDFEHSEHYDFIICNFFLDLFDEVNLKLTIKKIKRLMKTDAKLIVTDFQLQKGSIWQAILSKAMHVFFRITTGLQSRELKDIHMHLIDEGLTMNKEAVFFGAFAFSRVYS